MSGPTSKNECEEIDKDEEIELKKGHTTYLKNHRLFKNSSATWSLTKETPALGAKCVSDHCVSLYLMYAI